MKLGALSPKWYLSILKKENITSKCRYSIFFSNLVGSIRCVQVGIIIFRVILILLNSVSAQIGIFKNRYYILLHITYEYESANTLNNENLVKSVIQQVYIL